MQADLGLMSATDLTDNRQPKPCTRALGGAPIEQRERLRHRLRDLSRDLAEQQCSG
jgi:hypothetical protein